MLCITLYLVACLALSLIRCRVSGFIPASAGDAFFLKFPDPGFKLHDREQIVKRRLVRFAMHQLGNLHLKLHVQLDSRQLMRQPQLIEILPQALSDLAAYGCCVLNDAFHGTIFQQPLDRRLRADSGDSRNVVRLVSHQRQVVHNQIGADAKLFFDARDIQHFTGHGVHQSDVLIHQLCQILVAG